MTKLLLCKGSHCPIRESCQRFTKNSGLNESAEYFTITPFNSLLQKCKYLIKNKTN
jgi:hypothetical protein